MAPMGLVEFLIPALSAGIILASTAVFIFLSVRGGSPIHRVMVLNGLLAFGFVASEVMVLSLGSYQGVLPAARQFHRLEQVFGALFIYALPLLMGHMLKLRPGIIRFHKIWVGCSGAAALGFLLVAFITPEWFVNPQEPRASIALRVDVGRGALGPLYLVRDLLIGAAMLYALALGLSHINTQKRKRYVVPIVVGLALGFLLASDDISKAETGHYFTPFETPFSRVSIGFTILLLTCMASTLLRYLDQERELRRAYHNLHQMAYHDSLTGLPNRKALMERLTETLAQAKRGPEGALRAIILLDLHHFRVINDTWGSETGDAVLIEVGRRMRGALRQGDVVARVGHDEFAVLLTTLEREEGSGAAAVKVLAALATPFAPYGKDLRLSANAGLAIYPKDGGDGDSLFRRAEIALHQARRDELPFSHYTEHMQESIMHRMRLAERIRTAIECEEFHLYWQPQVNTMGRIVGGEALVRWKTGDRQISPAEFIPVAEETRLMLPLGDFILRKAFAQEVSWRLAGFKLERLAVNLSPRQLGVDSLVADITRFLGETGADPNRIELEITESGVMEDREGVRAKIIRLQELGIKFAIDDFGTGYSSLAYLQRFPAEVLKIDQAFVRGMRAGNLDARLVDAIIALAKTFSMETCAEGVETAEQAHSLVAAGVTRLQGYYFGKPMPPDEFTKLLEGQNS